MDKSTVSENDMVRIPVFRSKLYDSIIGRTLSPENTVTAMASSTGIALNGLLFMSRTAAGSTPMYVFKLLVARSVCVLSTFRSAVVSSTLMTSLSLSMVVPPVSVYWVLLAIRSSSDRKVNDDSNNVEASTVSVKERVRISDERFKLNEISSGSMVSGENADVFRLFTAVSRFPFMSLMASSVTVR